MSLTFALQALLARHEQFLLEAEDERRRMAGSINKLEQEKEWLKASNTQTIEENRHLLDQLEEMNQTISNGDEQIKSLTATLQLSEQENARLASLAARAADLESQLSTFESEQHSLREQISIKKEDERTAIQRWRTAERTINDLQDHVDKIEKESISERARHGEVMARLERRNAVERELGNAAGRLKGAAAVTRLGDGHMGTSVVSHFVKDILQDNANLQMGIVELKEMLSGSNVEVQNLREQMLMHQAVGPMPDEEITTPSLAAELAEPTSLEALPELHVHHHYHAPAKTRSTSIRRPKKRRNVTSPGYNTPSAASGLSTPCRFSSSLPRAPASSSLAILSHTAVTIPPTQQAEWPVGTSHNRGSFAASSVPSTPRSAFRSSTFDSTDCALESSRPTSPESISSEAPNLVRPRKQGSGLYNGRCTLAADIAPSNVKRASQDESYVSPQTASSLLPSNLAEDSSRDPGIIPEEIEDSNPTFSYRAPIRPTLHRSTSHESILSIKEPIPPFSRNTIRPQCSQLLTCPALKSRASIAPITTSETATAQRPASGNMDAPLTRGQDLLAKTVASNRHHSYSVRAIVRNESEVHEKKGANIDHKGSNQEGPLTTNAGIASRLNGWLVGKWGVTPTPTPTIPSTRASSSNLRAKATLGAQLEKGRAVSAEDQQVRMANPVTLPLAKQSLPSAPTPTPKLRHKPRTTGINQPGAINGLVLQHQQARRAERMATAVVMEPKEIDLDGLRESLGEG